MMNIEEIEQKIKENEQKAAQNEKITDWIKNNIIALFSFEEVSLEITENEDGKIQCELEEFYMSDIRGGIRMKHLVESQCKICQAKFDMNVHFWNEELYRKAVAEIYAHAKFHLQIKN